LSYKSGWAAQRKWRPSTYTKITLLKVAKSYADTGYFVRNLRAIEVPVNLEVVRDGRAEPSRRNSMISAMDIAPTISLSSASTTWLVPSVISTRRNILRRPCCLRAKRICYASLSRFQLGEADQLPSKMASLLMKIF
jgi:hypothetical protein